MQALPEFLADPKNAAGDPAFGRQGVRPDVDLTDGAALEVLVNAVA